MSQEELEQRDINRIEWFEKKVTDLPYHASSQHKEDALRILGSIDYRDIRPPVETQEDFSFLFATPAEYMAKALWLCLHMFFSLPCLGLSKEDMELPSTKKQRTEAVTSTSEVGVSPLSGTYNNTGYCKLNDILHFVGMSTESHELIDPDVLNQRYQKLNDLAGTLSRRNLNKIRYKFGFVENTYSLHSGNEGSWEQNTQEAFADHVLKPIRAIFQGLFPARKFNLEALNQVYRNQVDMSDKKDYQARPDRMFSVDGVPLVCIEVRYPSIKFDDETELMHVFSQAVYQCICSKTPYGIITDYETVFTFKLDLNDEELERIKQHTDEIKKGRYSHRLKRLKITYRRVKNFKPLHTPSTVVFDHILDAYMASSDKRQWYHSQRLMSKLAKALTLTTEDHNQRVKDEYDEFFSKLAREQATDANKVFVDIGDGESKEYTIVREVLDSSEFEPLQEGSKYNAQVLKIGQSFFERITGLTADTDSYILKVFDPVHGKREHKDFVFSKPSFMKFTKLTALREFEVYQTLEDLWGICVPKFFHFGCCLLEYKGKVGFGGLFMVLQYLEGPPPNTSDKALFISARHHLNEIHEKKVVHGDVKPRNMVNHNGKVLFVDFGHSSVIPFEEDEDERAWYKPDGEVQYSDLRDSDSSKLRDIFKDSKTPS